MTIIKYLIYRRAFFAFALLAGGILAVIFGLYGLPWQVLGYAGLVFGTLGLVAAGVDYPRVKRRAEKLNYARVMAERGAAELPQAEGFPEEDWREIAEILGGKAAQERGRADCAASEMAEYYTTWAHQIKTPISAMLLTLQGEDTPSSRVLSRELNRVEQYVEMALTFARLDSPSTDYVFRSCEIDEILRRAIRRFLGEFIARKLRLEFVESGARVVTDEKWLGFVVEQLLSNALKYTVEGGIFVGVEDGNTIVVRDTGIGIAEEDLPRVFEKGYTGKNGRVDERASGIGLYLCRRVIGNLGARIEISSELFVGTTVKVIFSQPPATGD